MIIIEDDVKKKIQAEFGYDEHEETLYLFLKDKLMRIMEAQNTIHRCESMLNDLADKVEKKAMDVELKTPVIHTIDKKPVENADTATLTQPLGLVPVSNNNGSQSHSVPLNETLDEEIEEELPPLVEETADTTYFNETPEIEKKDTEQQLSMYDEIQM